jgi:hypothetical protein
MIFLNKELFFALIAIYFFSHNRYANNFYHFVHCVNEFFSNNYYGAINDEIDEEEEEEDNKMVLEEMKYEDKYLLEIRKMNKKFIFDDFEKELQSVKILKILQSQSVNFIKETEEIIYKLENIELKLTKYEDKNYCENEDNEDNEDEDLYLVTTKEEKIRLLLEEKKILDTEYDNIVKKYNDIIKRTDESMHEATLFVIEKRLDKLKSCFVIEKTPLGNVLMTYNNDTGSFKYYSDNAIPYRYLETVARKYVKQFDCRPIFVDMEEELKLAEEKWEKKQKEKEEKERKQEELKALNIIVEPKKNVFAKFKSYNKDAGTGKVNMVAPPKNSIPNKKSTKEEENEKLLIKENANRYTYEGKFSNFSFLQKVERKVVDKKYGMKFSDFKKICEQKNNEL